MKRFIKAFSFLEFFMWFAVVPLFVLLFLAQLKFFLGVEVVSWPEAIVKTGGPGIFVGFLFASFNAAHRAKLGWGCAEYFMLFTSALIIHILFVIVIQDQFTKAIKKNPELCSSNYVLGELCSVAYSSDMFDKIK